MSILRALQERDPRSYQIFLQLPGGPCFLGSTPEQLYTRSGQAVASEAVAATRPRGPAGSHFPHSPMLTTRSALQFVVGTVLRMRPIQSYSPGVHACLGCLGTACIMSNLSCALL